MTKIKKTAFTKSLSQSKVDRLQNGNVEIEITIPWPVVSQSYQKTLEKLAKSAKVRGFRPGKAPAKLAERTLGKDKVYQEMIKSLFTEVYLEALKTHKLIPIVNPQISLLSSEEDKDWEIKAVTAEPPKIELGNYQEEIKKALAPDKIWVPGKNEKDEEEKEQSQEVKMQKILDALLKAVPLKIPPILLEEEVNRSLSRLIDQTARLGLTVEQYLTSIGKTSQQIREEYQKQAEYSIKIELILAAIAAREKIEVSDEEVTKMIEVTGDEKVKKSLQTPQERAYLKQILRKRKVIDKLSKL